MVDKHSREGRRSTDLAEQTVFVHWVAGVDLDARPFSLFAYRPDPEVLLQHPPASRVHNPCGRPDLRVGVCVDIVHEEIDQPALCLQHRQKADDLGIGLVCLRRNRRRSDRLGSSGSNNTFRLAPNQDRDQRDKTQRQRDTRQICLESTGRG